MQNVVLKYETENGTDEIVVGEDRVSFGRGSEAQYRFDDNGISRLHASIYREEDYIWIVDENSTHGTFVNGQKAEMSGSPITDGDEIKIGHNTILKVVFIKEAADETIAAHNASAQIVSTVSGSEERSSLLIPLAVTCNGAACGKCCCCFYWRYNVWEWTKRNC